MLTNAKMRCIIALFKGYDPKQVGAQGLLRELPFGARQ